MLKKIFSVMISAVMILGSCPQVFAEGDVVNINIDVNSGRREISPYIYGINENLADSGVSATAIRAGGNRYSAYNWETNASSAGSDWIHSSDNFLVSSLSEDEQNTPGEVALQLSEKCTEMGAYSMMTLQMAGYVSADMKGSVSERQTAPSERWNEVIFKKDGKFSLKPDLDDGVVYMDEFVNYLVKKLGDSSSKKGIKGYSLDNEPGLWSGTHARIHPEQTTCEELVNKSIELSEAVKDVDSGAEIFGPALYGFGAFCDLAGAPDWQKISEGKDYRWFIDYYLEEMKKAEETHGKRLLDAIDLHFYTEAQGVCNERYCHHYDNEECAYARMNSTRTLWDESYRERSWITNTGTDLMPLLPNLQQSIDKYYPGTKIAITEYNFGAEDHISGAVAEADALGIFAKYGVYLATLFTGENPFGCAAIDLYTNYDGEGSGFGDTLVSCESSDIERSTAYAGIFGDSSDVVTVVVTNKSFADKTTAEIALNGGNYSVVKGYTVDPETAEIVEVDADKIALNNNKVNYEMEPQSVSLLVIARDEGAIAKAAKKAGNAKIPLIVAGVAAVVAAGCAVCAVVMKKRK